MNMLITLGRQLGSGGRQIGQALAEHYGIAFSDKELIRLAAEESGLQPHLFEKSDERTRRRFMGLFPHNSPITCQSLFQLQSDTIRELAEQGSGIFVGRCADYILRTQPCLLRLFVSASEADRIKSIEAQYGEGQQAAKRRMEAADKDRAAYYNFYTTKQWGAAASYDLCINTSLLGVAQTIEHLRRVIDQYYTHTLPHETVS
jgi:cytidylate kinase